LSGPLEGMQHLRASKRRPPSAEQQKGSTSKLNQPGPPSSITGGPGFLPSCRFLPERAPPDIARADPPHRPGTRRVAGIAGLVGEVGVAELGVVAMGSNSALARYASVSSALVTEFASHRYRADGRGRATPAPHRYGNRVDGQLADERASFSRQVRLRQLRRSTPQDLVLLLQQPDPLPGLTRFGFVRRGGAGLEPVLDIGLPQPVCAETTRRYRSRQRSA
jgi:hypothetical protein